MARSRSLSELMGQNRSAAGTPSQTAPLLTSAPPPLAPPGDEGSSILSLNNDSKGTIQVQAQGLGGADVSAPAGGSPSVSSTPDAAAVSNIDTGAGGQEVSKASTEGVLKIFGGSS